MRRLLTVTLLLVLALPSAAHAGSVYLAEVPADSKYGYTETVLTFRATPGEHNRIVLTRITANGERAYVLHDEGATVPAPPSCTIIDEHTVSCAAYGAFIDAGDSDDTMTLRHAEAPGDRGGFDVLRGGPGADVLLGSGWLFGGAGDDVVMCDEQCRGSVLAGGAGSDRLRGSSEDEVLSGDGEGTLLWPQLSKPELTESGAAGNDTIDGGSGIDEITFAGRSTDVSVDLSAGTATGAGGEHDAIAGVESVLGGNGDDRLLGDAGDNTLQGGVGDDRIDGRGGDDDLLGYVAPSTNEYSYDEPQTGPDAGEDTLRGGEGDDRLDAGSERGDVLSGGPGADTLGDGVGGATHAAKVRCGSGRDTITFVPQGQLLSDCERLDAGDGDARIALRPKLRAHGRLQFDSSCLEGIGNGCPLRIGVRVGSSKLARRTLPHVNLRRSAFLLRPVRGARRGDVVDIRMDFASSLVSADGRVVLKARWRMPL